MRETDHRYIEAIRTGDRAALREIYSEHLPRISSLVTRNGGSYEDAKDVFQEALVVLFEKCRGGDFELRSAFGTLFYGVCRNIWGNRLKKKSRSEVTLVDDFKYTADTDLEREAIEEEKNRILWDAFRQIDAECRRLLDLFFEKKSMQEIVEAMHLSSVSYAKKRKFQCKERLLEKVRADPRYREHMA